MGRLSDSLNSHSTRLPPNRLRFLFFAAAVLGLCFLILCLNITLTYNKYEMLRKNNKRNYIEPNGEKFTINTDGCRIPEIKLLKEDIKKYARYPKEIQPCPFSAFPLLDNNRTHIWIKQSNKNYFIATATDTITCCYTPFYRPNSIRDIRSQEIDNRAKYNKCIRFTEYIEARDEYVKVECSNKGKVVYKRFFYFVIKKKKSSDVVVNKNKFAYNILVIGIDAVSRLNFHRTMPKTFQFLKSKGAVELLGYNKVGDNTFPNLIPMLLGIKETELRETCLPKRWSTFDNCPFVWEWYKQAGYYTAFAEDSSQLATFNYKRSGFAGTPTDYYLHTFINEAERHTGNNMDTNSFLCMNEKYFYEVLLDYIEDLTTTLKHDKLFGFFWETTMTHDFLNYPMAMDIRFSNFFKRLDNSNYLNATILFFVSDHGMRYGRFRSTKQGRLEARLPLVHVLVPHSFRTEYAEAFENLKLNSGRLTTPFDIHATLNDLIDLNNIQNEHIRARKLIPYSRNRTISLFLPIHTNRTCQVADIDDHWCTCQRGHDLPIGSLEAITAASQLIKYLNELLHYYRQCAFLKLSELIEVSELEISTTVKDKGKTERREFMVVVRTEPGNAIFEATLRYEDNRWTPSGTVSRLNFYGDQSYCIDNYQLKLYCFCV